MNQLLKSLDQQLPLFEGEIPYGSLALVAYTANSYYCSQKSGQTSKHTDLNKNLTLNINWAIVLGDCMLHIIVLCISIYIYPIMCCFMMYVPLTYLRKFVMGTVDGDTSLMVILA